MSTGEITAPRKSSQHELKLQIYLVTLFRRHVRPWDAILAMIANGGYRTPETTDLLNRMGLVRGVPDLVLLTHRARCRWIEVKLARTLHHDRTTLSEEQAELHDTLAWMDHKVDVVRSVREFWDVVEDEQIPHTMVDFPEQTVFDFRRRRGRSAAA